MRSLAYVVFLVLAAVCALAQAKKEKPPIDPDKPGGPQVTGTVEKVDHASSTIIVHGPEKVWELVYSADTRVTYRGKTSGVREVKEGRRVICWGKFNEREQLVAARIDIRDEK